MDLKRNVRASKSVKVVETGKERGGDQKKKRARREPVKGDMRSFRRTGIAGPAGGSRAGSFSARHAAAPAQCRTSRRHLGGSLFCGSLVGKCLSGPVGEAGAPLLR